MSIGKRMVEKRSGRQSADNAEHTKEQILCAAAALFCEKGYDKVSVREISERAGVSHGLIRHHFGAKQLVWERICDGVHQEFGQILERLVSEMDPSMLANVRLYTLMSRLTATLLLDPRPCQLMAGAVRENTELFDYLKDHPAAMVMPIEQALKEAQDAGFMRDSSVEELKWMMIVHLDAATTLTPMLLETFGEDKSLALYRHWLMYCRSLGSMLGIEHDSFPHPATLEESAIERICGLSC
ncbi:TetR/AcrR family transcriptional regulator [Ferrimonas pelagia]|uniref:TetR/AcrR family transcriptional regulator n=1 Tax=Ferrimonas pelagia TaxID=1177826 RepID=A0ABP9ENZ2_9GAMM